MQINLQIINTIRVLENKREMVFSWSPHRTGQLYGKESLHPPGTTAMFWTTKKKRPVEIANGEIEINKGSTWKEWGVTRDYTVKRASVCNYSVVTLPVIQVHVQEPPGVVKSCRLAEAGGSTEMASLKLVQDEHKVFPWLRTFITRKLRGLQTYFLPLLTTTTTHRSL